MPHPDHADDKTVQLPTHPSTASSTDAESFLLPLDAPTVPLAQLELPPVYARPATPDAAPPPPPPPPPPPAHPADDDKTMQLLAHPSPDIDADADAESFLSPLDAPTVPLAQLELPPVYARPATPDAAPPPPPPPAHLADDDKTMQLLAYPSPVTDTDTDAASFLSPLDAATVPLAPLELPPLQPQPAVQETASSHLLPLGAPTVPTEHTLELPAPQAHPEGLLPLGAPTVPLTGSAEQRAPDADAIREQIMIQLMRMESLHNVRVLLAVESGSRAWGFASPNSDWDVRFIYAPRLPWYLRVNATRDVIELPLHKYASDDLDINGWELRKTLGLMQKCNPTLLEWLQSPLVYRQNDDAVAGLRALAREFFSPAACWHHYFSMAKGNNREYLQGKTVRLKKYLYVLRPLLCCQWIEQYNAPAPMLFRTLVDTLVKDAELRLAIDALLEQKRGAAELAEGPRVPALGWFIENELQRCEQAAAKVAVRKASQEAYYRCDEFLRATIMGA
ncbi:MAG TPA: nucleotidyltransferase domain-containing protein [Burkholderiales bacterium]